MTEPPPHGTRRPRPGRKPRGAGHERVAEILGEARALFVEHGIEHVTTRQIASRVGISQTALYVYFDSRAAILNQLTDMTFRALDDAMARAPMVPDDPAASLSRLLEAFIRFGLLHPEEYQLAFVLKKGPLMQNTPPPNLHPAGLQAFSRLHGLIVEGQSHGCFRGDLDSAGMAQCLWAAIHGLVALYIARPYFTWLDIDTLIATQTALLTRGIAHAVLPSGHSP